MAVFSTNQNRQLYVVKSAVEGGSSLTPGKANAGQTLATITADNDLYIQQVNANGVIVRSDIIPAKNIVSASYAYADNLAKPIKTQTLTLDANYLSSGNVIAGQDYIVRVNFRQLYGMSDEDIYQKYGAVHATAGMTASNFYKEMAYSLVKNFNRVYAPLLEVKLVVSGTAGETIARATKTSAGIKFYNAAGTEIYASATAAGIAIQEKTQEDLYVRGVKPITPVYFEVIPTTITVDGDEVVWGTVATSTTTGLNNSYDIADLEYFCMGERGDQYRNLMWPKSIPTEYLAVPGGDGYNVINIHYYYAGTCEDALKSEKDITLVSTLDAADIADTVIAPINEALTIAGIDPLPTE